MGIQYGNALVYLLAIVASIVFMISNNEYLDIINGAFEMVFCLLLIGIEAHVFPMWFIEKLKNDIGFLFRPIGRLLFIIFLGLMLFGFGTFGIIMGIIMVAWTAINVFVYHKYPGMLDHGHLDTDATPPGADDVYAPAGYNAPVSAAQDL
eukprot:CAMPEP_0185767404 /NCGR_PEP_ID=MMETSP1174-20130828/43000_1 /TAXON_ID=35687 /ORGANISM="Dictyocha speculum, Strain CCMP1381" /LENGTH=149 /DNA_ID=CAMNT_0028451589 /DNA_START=33 /DNA_END=482 /DNA_ORIENTATION=+